VRALVLLVAVAGCPSVSTPPTGRSYDDAGCQIGCDRCPPLAVCITAPYQPACLAPCQTSSDCAKGQLCGVVATDDMPPPTCLAPATLKWCDPPPHPCNVQQTCRDPQTLLRPLPFLDQICGWEVVHCDSSCDLATGSCK
jgi:hypothetical protein